MVRVWRFTIFSSALLVDPSTLNSIGGWPSCENGIALNFGYDRRAAPRLTFMSTLTFRRRLYRTWPRSHLTSPESRHDTSGRSVSLFSASISLFTASAFFFPSSLPLSH